MFCPKCKSILLPKIVKGKKVLACSCGYKDSEPEKVTLKETSPVHVKPVDVIEEGKESLPVTEQECQKCGNSQAYHWEVQTRAGDEPATRFFKCTKCKHTWREYK